MTAIAPDATDSVLMPPHLEREDYDEARAIDEEEGRAFARRLAKQEGIFAGISTGLNVLAACQIAERASPRPTRRARRRGHGIGVPRRRPVRVGEGFSP